MHPILQNRQRTPERNAQKKTKYSPIFMVARKPNATATTAKVNSKEKIRAMIKKLCLKQKATDLHEKQEEEKLTFFLIKNPPLFS